MEQSNVQLITIDADQVGQRVDNFLLARLKGVPKSRIYRLVRKGEVRVNKGRIKPEYKLQLGDVLRVPPVRIAEEKVLPAPGRQLSELLHESVLYEDEGLLVVNKPSGLAVHGGSGVNLGLIEALRQIRPGNRFLALVHRLDRDTSGCVMVAKKRSYLRFLQQGFRERKVSKKYLALVAGHWPKNHHCVDVPLRRNLLSSGERVVRVAKDGKPSQTGFKAVKYYPNCTLVEARPITGRTHQIRVHAQHVGCPLIGDSKYGNDAFNTKMKREGFNRLFLHADSLSFRVPDKESSVTIKTPFPEDFANALIALDTGALA